MTTLSESEEQARGRGFDALTAVARAILNAGPEWEWFAFDVLNDEQTLVTGARPPHPKASGRARWQGVGEGQRCVVTRTQMRAARTEFERTTGKCCECNEGERWVGWSCDHGHRYAPCGRCNGTGRAPTTEGR